MCVSVWFCVSCAFLCVCVRMCVNAGGWMHSGQVCALPQSYYASGSLKLEPMVDCNVG